MKIAIDCGYHKDIISIPDHIGTNLEDLIHKFDEWIYDKNNDHEFWIYVDGEKRAVEVGTDSFLEYLNKYQLCYSKEKAYIVHKELQEIPEGMPVMQL